MRLLFLLMVASLCISSAGGARIFSVEPNAITVGFATTKQLTVTGQGFTSDSAFSCSLGGIVLATQRLSDAILTCGVTPGWTNMTTSTEAFDVLEDGQPLNASLLVFFTENTVVQSIFPDQGPQTGSTVVNVRGSGFFDGPALQCDFGSGPVVASYTDTTSITCQTGVHESGSSPVQFSVEPMQLGYSMEFDGLNDFLTQSYKPELAITGNWTYESWFKMNAMPQGVTSALVEHCFPGESLESNCLYYLEITFDGKVLVGHEYAEGVNQKFFYNTALEAQKWYHIAVTRNADAMQYILYINGEQWPEIYQYQVQPEGGSTSTYIGAFYTTLFWNGIIDEIRIWSRVLEQDEIIDHMYSQLTGDELGLNGYWNFDDNDGATTKDRSPWGNDLLLGGNTDVYAPQRKTTVMKTTTVNATLPFSFYEPEVILSLKPTAGPFEGRTQIEITGSNFRDTETLMCQFGKEVVPATFFSSSLIVCESIPVLCGSYELIDLNDYFAVSVSNNGQQFPNGTQRFFFYESPSIVSIMPDRGPAAGGSVIVISGQKFIDHNETTCKFGTQIVPGVVVSDTRIECTCPAIMGDSDVVPVEVSNNGQQYTVNSILFRYQDPEEIYAKATSILAVIILIAATLVIITATLTLITTYLARDVSVFRRANPLFCYITLVGLILATASIYFTVGKPDTVSCTFRFWFGGVGFALVFGGVFAKVFWLWWIFDASITKAFTIKNSELVLPVALAVALELVLLTIWSALDPPTAHIDPKIIDGDLTSSLTCKSEYNSVFLCLFYGIKGFILAVGAFFVFKTRKLPTAFNESKSIGLVIYNCLLVGLLLVPITALVDMSPEVKFLIESLVVLFLCITTLVFLFGTKLWLFFTKQAETPEESPGHSGKQASKSQELPQISTSHAESD